MTDSASVLKELRKLPENKVCMDCTDKMPSFVCLELGTFVCTSCAGIHRELGHHIKSVTLSIFTPEEVELVSAGGNQNAKKIWLGKWTPSVFPQPGPSDKANIREFIKLKYIDKLWYAMPSNPLAAPESKPATVNTETSQAASSMSSSLAVDPVEQYKSPFETPKVNPVESSVSWRANFDQFDAAVNKLNKSLDILEIQEQSAKAPSKPAESQYQHQSGDLITFDLLTGAVPPPKPQEQPQQTQYIVRESSPPRLNQSQGDSNQMQAPQTSQYVVKEQPPPQYIQQPQQSPQPSPNHRVASPPSPSTTYQQQMTQQSPPMMHGAPMPQMVSNYPYGTQFMGPQMVPPMMPPMGAMPMPVYLNQYGQPMPMPQMGGPQPMMMPMPIGPNGMPMPMAPNGVPIVVAPGNPKATQGGMPQPIIVNQYGQPVTLPPGVQPIPIMLPPGAQPPGSWLSRPNLPAQQQAGKPSASVQSNQHLSDYELAKKLQEEENRQANNGGSNNKKPAVVSQPSKPAFKPMSDEEYARRLQEEENSKGGGGNNSYKTTPSVTNPGRGAYFKSDEELARQLAQEEEEDE